MGRVLGAGGMRCDATIGLNYLPSPSPPPRLSFGNKHHKICHYPRRIVTYISIAFGVCVRGRDSRMLFDHILLVFFSHSEEGRGQGVWNENCRWIKQLMEVSTYENNSARRVVEIGCRDLKISYLSYSNKSGYTEAVWLLICQFLQSGF